MITTEIQSLKSTEVEYIYIIDSSLPSLTLPTTLIEPIPFVVLSLLFRFQ